MAYLALSFGCTFAVTRFAFRAISQSAQMKRSNARISSGEASLRNHGKQTFPFSRSIGRVFTPNAALKRPHFEVTIA